MLRRHGFTLIELMIVIGIIAIIAAIAIPGLLRARVSANESSAIGTLRTLATAQAQYQAQAQSNQDGDDTGEYGLLGELAGTVQRRGNGVLNAKANPSFVTHSFGPKSGADYSEKSGYLFKVYLPGPVTDAGVTDPTPLANGPVVKAQETKWRGYAWPASVKVSGIRCFAIDQAAELLAAPNTNGTAFRYNGVMAGSPTYSAAAAASEPDNTLFIGNFAPTIGIDGQQWANAGS